MIPKILLQTSKEKLPQYVFDLLKPHINGWEYKHFVDSEIIEFFEQNPLDEFPDIVEVFNNIALGEHKADFFRYYFLYLNGGVFVDSDFEVKTDLNVYAENYEYFATQCAHPNEDYYFQGFIGCEPKNKIVYEAFKDTYNLFKTKTTLDSYIELCKRFKSISIKYESRYKSKIFTERGGIDGFTPVFDSDVVIGFHYAETEIIPPAPINPDEERHSRKQLIRTCYLNLLKREPDENGMNHYLSDGWSIYGIVRDMKASQEYREICIETKKKNITIYNEMLRYERSGYSQNGEDGVLEHIFEKIGTTNKVAVEIGVSVTAKDENGNYYSDDIENNTAELSQKGWNLYWFDIIDPFFIPVNCTFVNKCLTKDNIVGVFEQNNIPKEFDLLSIDIDSNDYYLRDALKDYSPRVVISEYNGCFDGKTEHIMPYNENYIWPGTSDTNYGVSLKSLVKQANELGYDLVYCESQGVNAFFVRKDINPFRPLTSEQSWVKLHWAP